MSHRPVRAVPTTAAPGGGSALRHWQALLDALGDAAWIVRAPALTVCAANDAAARLLGQARDALPGARADALMATPEDLAYWDDAARHEPGTLQSDSVLVDAAGRLLQVQRRIQPLAADAAPDGTAGRHFLVTVRDMSAQAREAEERENLVAQLQATLESTADGILVTDLAGRIRVFNRRFAQIWGLPEDLLAHRDDAAIFDWMRRSVVDPDAYARQLASIAEATLLASSERIQLHSGQVLERVTQPQCSQGRPCGRVWSFRDLTDMVRAGQRIEALATTDALTGLANRRSMGQAMAQAIREVKRGGGTGPALLVLDLDRFKDINDSLGPALGDRVLKEVAERVKGCLRQGDLLARVGGDQFAVLIHDADMRGAEVTGRRVLDAVAAPLTVDELQFTLTCSIGAALYPADGTDAEALARHAESAMQRAKDGGRASMRFHQPRHDADLRERLKLDHAMRQALAAGRFRLHYQPQVDLASGGVIGAEALIRWRDPALGDIPPGRFIPVAEDTGFIIAIGDWVLADAVRQAAHWRHEGLAIQVSVNVSALQFQQADFVERVRSVLAEADLPGSLLELELTESILVRDAEEALLRLDTLARMGVKLAIDDFGTGYSSLAYMKRFPIDRLKIDKSFIDGVPQDNGDAGIVRAIVQMSHAMGAKVIAEGVETEPQRAFLAGIGCDQFQGWLFAKALPAAEFEERLRSTMRPSRRHLQLVGR
ncbi:MAG: putative bifunctional diguanylate cyclase/phosphodiesterase [Aquabacterium sp.]